ncbi:MAG TPA: radical SAM family heme chaperone HemW [Dehalococcoidia bacterium]|nr:radical SAM family heme chaperone HemW [Dehalococcoidia bacterium]
MPESTIGLYVHIPFCTAKCGYCDFNSYANHEHMIPSYGDTLLKDATLWRDAVGARQIGTLFFGGGTPSLTPVDDMTRIIDGLRATFAFAPDAEVSLEANPGSLTTDYLRGLRDIGFNRISIGVQSFDDEELVSLDRIHTRDDALAAYRSARDAGFENVNLDFIYGLPEQPMSNWQRTLEEAVALRPDHLSLYALTVEEGTPLARDIARGRTTPPDPDAQADQYEWTMDRMATAGYEQYEISNWALPGRRCAHNLVYWQNREYLGLGAGAHSFLNGVRFSTVLLPNRYVELVDASAEAMRDGHGAMQHVIGAETITGDLSIADTLILGLRLNDGIDLQAFRARYNRTVDDVHGALVAEFESYGILDRTVTHLRLTRRGRLLSNELFQRLLPEASATPA